MVYTLVLTRKSVISSFRFFFKSCSQEKKIVVLFVSDKMPTCELKLCQGKNEHCFSPTCVPGSYPPSSCLLPLPQVVSFVLAFIPTAGPLSPSLCCVCMLCRLLVLIERRYVM
jgi:hypothetical protein